MENNISFEQLKQLYEGKLSENERAKTEIIKSQAEINLSIKTLNQKLSELDEEFKVMYGLNGIVLTEDTSLEDLKALEQTLNSAFNSLKGKLANYLMTDQIETTTLTANETNQNHNPYEG